MSFCLRVSRTQKRVSFVRSFAEDTRRATISLQYWFVRIIEDVALAYVHTFSPFFSIFFLSFFFLVPLGNYLHYYHSLHMLLRFLLNQCIITYIFRNIYSYFLCPIAALENCNAESLFVNVELTQDSFIFGTVYLLY